MIVRIRAVRADELESLREIERAAGVCFREVGMPQIADDAPLPVTALEGFRRDGAARVVVDDADMPVAYALTRSLDGAVHVEQISVHPTQARRGVGRALLDHLAARAMPGGPAALTLTTFADVPWNAPYYERCGFRRLPERVWTPGLRTVREQERAAGLDRWPRVCMRRDA